MLGRAVGQRLGHGRAAGLWSDELRQTCAACDALALNLECCISARGAPTRLIRDKPFFFRSPPEGVDALLAIDATVAGVANNHALDFGQDALADTLGELRGAGLTGLGAGADEREARRGAVVTAGGRRLGVLAVSDHPAEFAAGRDSPGVAYADLRRGI